MGEKLQAVDLCGGSCYGKQTLKKLFHKDEYIGGCQEECRLKQACISASREQTEFIQDQMTNIPYDQGKLGGSRDFDIESASDFNERSDDPPEFYNIGGFPIPCDIYPFVFEFAGRMARLYFDKPKVFDAIMRKVFKQMQLTDQAKERGVSRQAFSASIARELLDMKPEKTKFRDTLDGLELAVYSLCFEDGCTVRSAAVQLGISKDKVQRLRQKISTKLNATATKKHKK